MEGMKPNGFSFDGTDDSAIDYALDRAISLAYDKPSEFRALQANCMTQDWSWNRPALSTLRFTTRDESLTKAIFWDIARGGGKERAPKRGGHANCFFSFVVKKTFKKTERSCFNCTQASIRYMLTS